MAGLTVGQGSIINLKIFIIMGIVIKSEEIRNVDDNCTILIEQYAEKPYFTPFWRYYYKYDGCEFWHKGSDMLKNKPSKKRLSEMF